MYLQNITHRNDIVHTWLSVIEGKVAYYTVLRLTNREHCQITKADEQRKIKAFIQADVVTLSP